MAEEDTVTPNNDTVPATEIPATFDGDQKPVTPEAEVVTPETDKGEDGTLLGPDKKDSPETGDEPKGEVPESYDIKLEEGLEMDEGTLELFTPIFKELGITNDGGRSAETCRGIRSSYPKHVR